MTTYNTNLASEFFVLSTLHRLGTNAFLTLGNRKAVDIFIVKKNQTVVTIDVKGLADKADWPADNIRERESSNHFYAMVSFNGQIEEPGQLPSTWIIPAKEIGRFIKTYPKGGKNVARSMVQAGGKKFWQAWYLILNQIMRIPSPDYTE